MGLPLSSEGECVESDCPREPEAGRDLKSYNTVFFDRLVLSARVCTRLLHSLVFYAKTLFFLLPMLQKRLSREDSWVCVWVCVRRVVREGECAVSLSSPVKTQALSPAGMAL